MTLLYQAAVERSEISWVQSGNLAMDIVANVLMSLDTAGGRLLDAVDGNVPLEGKLGHLVDG